MACSELQLRLALKRALPEPTLIASSHHYMSAGPFVPELTTSFADLRFGWLGKDTHSTRNLSTCISSKSTWLA